MARDFGGAMVHSNIGRDDDDEELLKVVKEAIRARRPPGFRPLPVLIEGKQLPMEELLKKARSLGGCRNITEAKQWAEVAAALGFEPRCGPSVKLVYFKYLKLLESGNALKTEDNGVCRPRRSSSVGGKSDDTTPVAKRRRLGKENLGNAENGVGPEDMESDVGQALVWLKRVAVDPGNAARGQGRPGSSQNEQWVKKCSKLVSRYRAALARSDDDREKRRTDTPYGLRAKHASANQHVWTEAPSCSRSCPVGPRHQAHIPPPKKYKAGPSPAVIIIDCDGKAHLPMTGSRFLGQQVWPPKRSTSKPAMNRVGKGRSACRCEVKNSLECIQLHQKQEKRKILLELGEPTFKRWGFHRTGEALAKEWSKEEQALFVSIFAAGEEDEGEVKDYWKELRAAFPNRPRSELVNYYFNVFVLRRRAVQNRAGLEPDSDVGY